MSDSASRRLSVSLALQALQEASERVWALETSLAEARALRDEYIAEWIDYIPVTRLSRITKLSRQSIYKIAPGKISDRDD